MVREAVSLGGVALDGPDTCWIEGRPSEGGRNVLVRCTESGSREDVTPQGYDVRTRVHEYGGGACVIRRGEVYFSNFADQRIYRQMPGVTPEPITPEGPSRYADACVDEARRRLVCVHERHRGTGAPVNTIASVPLRGGTAKDLVAGADFYSSPRLSPDGQRLAWLSWDHPHMPWDESTLWVADVLQDGSLGARKRIAGGDGTSVFQPEWSPGGNLHFVADDTGWWNLWVWNGRDSENLLPMEAEFGLPQWVFGMSTYAFITDDLMVCTYCEKGRWKLGTLRVDTRELSALDTPYTVFYSLHACTDRVVFVGGSRDEPPAVVRLDPRTRSCSVLRRSMGLGLDSGALREYASESRPVEFGTEDGGSGFGYYYAPRSRDFRAPPDDRPPLIVHCHGGPTSAVDGTFSLGKAYWTSRGFAVLDVNYRGSTGYGRAYREQLYGTWGVVDVDDCASGAQHLADEDIVDGRRLIISGGSAGGFTVLCALVFRDTFAAGASHYGVSDVESLARDTHKFESRYMERLIGPYPESADAYRDRSPIHFADRLSCPVIFFQGMQDKVVPPEQAVTFFDALRKKRIPVAYVPFQDEGHGFRRGDNIIRAFEGELYFYSRVFGLDLPDPIEPVSIENDRFLPIL